MKNLILPFLVIFFILTSCNSDQEKLKIPSNVLPMKKMEAYLYDLHLLEAKLQQGGLRQDTASQLFPRLEKEILKKHRIDSIQVDRSLKFYTAHIDKLDSIYTHLAKRTETGK